MITVDGVTKTYGGHTAVDDVSFVARPGRVTGFLGPNGAGKSTTMRIMVGLTPASTGRVTIGGHRYGDLPNPGLLVGVLLDASAQHNGRTGREILTIGAETMGLPRARVDEMLELVSLSPTEARRRLRDYSLGMRQRLGHRPRTARRPAHPDPRRARQRAGPGRDPLDARPAQGLRREGGTVLLSSHLLHEVEKIADDLVLIGQGRIVAQGTKQELLQTRGAYVKAVEHESLVGRAAVATGSSRSPSEKGCAATPTPPDRRRRRCRRSHPRRAAAGRRRRPRGPLPAAHRRHPARRSTGMSTVTSTPIQDAATQAHDIHEHDRPVHHTTHPALAADPGRAAQDGEHPVRQVAADRHRCDHAGRHRASSTPPRTRPTGRSSTSWRPPTVRRACCSRCSASCWSPASGASAPPWCPSR